MVSGSFMAMFRELVADGLPNGAGSSDKVRREAARGRLRIERIANKDFVTLAEIKRMRELCRVQAKEHGCTSAKPATAGENSSPKPSGSSETAAKISPQDALRARLKESHLHKPSKP
jgi:hypothetical protein